MATVKPTEFRIKQNYGGLKTAYFEIDSVSAGDTIDFSEKNVHGLKIVWAQDASSGAFVPCPVSGDSTATVDSGFTGSSIKGEISYRSY